MTLKLEPMPAIRPGPEPIARLGEHGRRAWESIQSEHEIHDSGGVLLLSQICGAIDRLAALDEVVEREGVTVRGPRSSKVHPAAREQTALRVFVCKQLAQLDAVYGPVRYLTLPGEPRAARKDS
jgi:hypothetical protein